MELDLLGQFLERTGSGLRFPGLCFVGLVLHFQVVNEITVGADLLEILQRLRRVEVEQVLELLQFVREDLLSLL